MKIIGKNKLAQAFKVSRTTIDNWSRSGCPSEFNGKEHEFTLSEVIKWHEQRFLKNSDASDYEKSRATREHFKALLSELEYKERSGELVPSEAVKAAAFDKARQVRDSLMTIPARISPILAAEHDAKKVNEMLDKEIRQCLEVLANDTRLEGDTE